MDDPAVRPLVKVLARTAAWDRVCITSFSARRLGAVRRELPRPVCTATSPIGVGVLRLGAPRRVLGPQLRGRAVRCGQSPGSVAAEAFLPRAHPAGRQPPVRALDRRKRPTGPPDIGARELITD